MSYEGYIAIISLILSMAIGIGGLRKGKADTFGSYQDALQKAQDNYDKLVLRFDALEKKYCELELKYDDMETWNKALARQLVECGMTPITMAQAKKYSNGK